MSARNVDPGLRTALIEEAARLIAVDGSRALTLRRLTSAVGVSTMAVYTHFGGIKELRQAIRLEGFNRLAHRMDAVEITDDPIADLVVLGWAYYIQAITDPNLYRSMFMEDLPEDGDGIGYDTFERLVAAMERCRATRGFDQSDPADLARRVWAVAHGVVALRLAGFLTADEADTCFRRAGENLIAALSGDPTALSTSLAGAGARIRRGMDDAVRVASSS